MTLNIHRPSIIMVLVAALQIPLIVGSLGFAQAQEPSPFQISIIPAADHAVSGQPFTYTVVVTNVSDAPVQYATIHVDVPEGTNFIRTKYSDPKWYGGNSFADPEQVVEQVRLSSPDTIAVGENFTFEMIVEVVAEVDARVLISDYDATSVEDNASTTGPPIQVNVREPTPSPTPTLLPPPTLIPTATAITVPATPQAAVNTPINPSGDVEQLNTVGARPETREIGSMTVTIIMVAALILVMIFIGMTWLLRNR